MITHTGPTSGAYVATINVTLMGAIGGRFPRTDVEYYRGEICAVQRGHERDTRLALPDACAQAWADYQAGICPPGGITWHLDCPLGGDVEAQMLDRVLADAARFVGPVRIEGVSMGHGLVTPDGAIVGYVRGARLWIGVAEGA